MRAVYTGRQTQINNLFFNLYWIKHSQMQLAKNHFNFLFIKGDKKTAA